MIDRKTQVELVSEFFEDTDEISLNDESESTAESCPDFEPGKFNPGEVMECDEIGAFMYCKECKWNSNQ